MPAAARNEFEEAPPDLAYLTILPANHAPVRITFDLRLCAHMRSCHWLWDRKAQRCFTHSREDQYRTYLSTFIATIGSPYGTIVHGYVLNTNGPFDYRMQSLKFNRKEPHVSKAAGDSGNAGKSTQREHISASGSLALRNEQPTVLFSDKAWEG